MLAAAARRRRPRAPTRDARLVAGPSHALFDALDPSPAFGSAAPRRRLRRLLAIMRPAATRKTALVALVAEGSALTLYVYPHRVEKPQEEWSRLRRRRPARRVAVREAGRPVVLVKQYSQALFELRPAILPPKGREEVLLLHLSDAGGRDWFRALVAGGSDYSPPPSPSPTPSPTPSPMPSPMPSPTPLSTPLPPLGNQESDKAEEAHPGFSGAGFDGACREAQDASNAAAGATAKQTWEQAWALPASALNSADEAGVDDEEGVSQGQSSTGVLPLPPPRDWESEGQALLECDNVHRILAVDRDAPRAEIRKAFRALALQWHPDKNEAPCAPHCFNHIHAAFRLAMRVAEAEEAEEAEEAKGFDAPPATPARESSRRHEPTAPKAAAARPPRPHSERWRKPQRFRGAPTSPCDEPPRARSMDFRRPRAYRRAESLRRGLLPDVPATELVGGSAVQLYDESSRRWVPLVVEEISVYLDAITVSDGGGEVFQVPLSAHVLLRSPSTQGPVALGGVVYK